MSAPAPAAKKTVAKVAKKEEVVAVAAPVAVAPPAAPVAAVEKKATKAKAAKAEVAAPAPVAAAPAVVAASAVASAAAPVAEVPVQTVGEEIKLMVTGVTTMRETLGGLLTQLKKLEKRVGREIKDARKRKRRVRVEDANGEVKPAKLSIFEIPTKLTEELCSFLGKPKGSEMSRSNVTKAVTTYIKEKGLKNKHDIKPDAPLRKLLAVPETEALTYFNLQRYLNKHYIKAVKPEVAH
jgi:chromatin remodeling complex protein RSC6